MTFYLSDVSYPQKKKSVGIVKLTDTWYKGKHA